MIGVRVMSATNRWTIMYLIIYIAMNVGNRKTFISIDDNL